MLALRHHAIRTTFVRRYHLYLDRYEISSTGISPTEFRQRRLSLVDLVRNHLKTEQENSSSTHFTISVPAATRLFMGPDVAYFPFKQQSDFYYLTGCMQPDALLLLSGDDRAYSTSLLLPPCPMASIDEYERWFGPTITDKDSICELFGIDAVYPLDKLTSLKFPSSSVLFHEPTAGNDTILKRKYLVPFLKRFSSSVACQSLNSFMHALRSIKSSAEQTLVRQACQFASTAFRETIKNCGKSTANESLVQARFQFECARSGSPAMAFYPVVAANGRSNILHYQNNDQPIHETDLIMLDGGCLFKQYASDITRFWPMSGRFTSAQRLLYEILLAVQKDLIAHLNSGSKSITRSQLNALTDQFMIKYLREELILSRSIDDAHARRIVNTLSPTSVSHHLGLDVHDCEAIPFSETLQAGNVLTIEPGLYIPHDCADVPAVYRGFATRIEDDVLLTGDGCDVLTKQCPKEIDELYRLLDARDRISG